MITTCYDEKKILSQYESTWGKVEFGNHESEALFFETMCFNMHIPAGVAMQVIKSLKG